MKGITPNSPKGGLGKSTTSILFINALTAIGKRVLALDTDTVNHSLSSYYDDRYTLEDILEKNIFNLFSGRTVKENTLPIKDNLDLVHGLIRKVCHQLSCQRHRESTFLKFMLIRQRA